MSKYTIKQGDEVYLIPAMKAVRKTRGGLWLCEIQDRQISIPESMLHNRAGKEYIEGNLIRYLFNKFFRIFR